MARKMSRKQQRRFSFWEPSPEDRIHPLTCIKQNLPPFQLLGWMSMGDWEYEHDFRNFTGNVRPRMMGYG